jgi:hypothetical protein
MRWEMAEKPPRRADHAASSFACRAAAIAASAGPAAGLGPGGDSLTEL